MFIGDDSTARLFCGIEFPVANNLYEGSTFCFTQAPYAELIETYVSRPVVYGMDNCGDLTATFLSYMKRKMRGDGKPLRIYCDWGLHDDLTPGEPTMSAALTLDNTPRVAELNRKSGAGFDYYLMDAFWFEKGKPYTDFDPVAFPEGMGKIKAAMDEAGLKLGLWFDINGIHTGFRGFPNWRSTTPSWGTALSAWPVTMWPISSAGHGKADSRAGRTAYQVGFRLFRVQESPSQALHRIH